MCVCVCVCERVNAGRSKQKRAHFVCTLWKYCKKNQGKQNNHLKPSCVHPFSSLVTCACHPHPPPPSTTCFLSFCCCCCYCCCSPCGVVYCCCCCCCFCYDDDSCENAATPRPTCVVRSCDPLAFTGGTAQNLVAEPACVGVEGRGEQRGKQRELSTE